MRIMPITNIDKKMNRNFRSQVIHRLQILKLKFTTVPMIYSVQSRIKLPPYPLKIVPVFHCTQFKIIKINQKFSG